MDGPADHSMQKAYVGWTLNIKINWPLMENLWCLAGKHQCMQIEDLGGGRHRNNL